jgi:phosphoribosylglycinamide formyltransferase-1
MRLLSPYFVSRFRNRIINIHPSLLPSFPGTDAVRQAIEYGVKITGCTVHFVDEELDHGPIISQSFLTVLDEDDEDSLSARLLEVEHLTYISALIKIASNGLEIIGRSVKYCK